MAEDGHQSGVSTGSRWGCASAIVIGGLAFVVMTAIAAVGDCAPGYRCYSPSVAGVLLLAAGMAFAVGLTVRALVNLLKYGRN